MSDLAATVIIPTFEHGRLIRFALESALAQTVPEIEIFVVGDGAPDVTREVVGELSARDARVRYFDNPKGPRHGEIHRHAALAEARGEAVFYLADDDLWLPEHVATLLPLLREVDLVSAMRLKIAANGTWTHHVTNLGDPMKRERFFAGHTGILLSQAAHTLAAYRRLPFGWRTTPPNIATDAYMWQQFLADESCRAAAANRATVLNLGSPARTEMTEDERYEELQTWSNRVHDPAERAELHAELFARALGEVHELKLKNGQLREKLVQTRGRLCSSQERVQSMRERLRRKPGD